MVLEYNMQQQYQNSLYIADVGDVALRGTNYESDYYILVRASFGKAKVLKFGPMMADTTVMKNNFALMFREFDFKESSVLSDITKYMNDPKKEITTITEITVEEALSAIPGITTNFMED